MDKLSLIAKGDIAKYQLIIHHSDFDAAENDAFVILHWGMRGASKRIEKSEMFTNEDGELFVFFDSADMFGTVKAETHFVVTDGDMESGEREVVDYQFIGLVTDSGCSQSCSPCCCGDTEEKQVEWVRKLDSDLNTVFLNLRTCDKEPILDSEGKPLRVRKSQINS